MGLKDLLKSTLKRALGREAPPAPEARPTRSGSHPAPPPWRAAPTEPAPEEAAQAAPAQVEPAKAEPAQVEAAAPEVIADDQVSENPNDSMDSGSLPPGDDPQVAGPTLDVLLELSPEAWAPSPEERARYDGPQDMAPPPAITPSASHETVVELQAAPIAPQAVTTPAPGAPATGLPAVNPDAEFKVHLINEQEGIDLVITTFVGEPVLDAADRQGLALPYSCRNGGCTICAGKLVTGEADMGDQYVLEPEQIAAGFRLLCCAWVTSDATIITHQNDAVS